MIGSLRGTLIDRSPRGEVLVEVGGVGYRVVVPAGTLAGLGPEGSLAFLHVYQHVRDDAVTLYGFTDRDERVCFEAMLGAHGVGPALALAILSVHSPASLQRALLEGDVDALTMVPGVGKKTAARLMIELKAKLDVPDIDLRPVGTDAGDATRLEVRTALAGLGYGPDEVRHVLQALPPEGAVEDLLRQALRLLAVAR